MFVDLSNKWTYVSILIIGISTSFLVKFLWSLMSKPASENQLPKDRSPEDQLPKNQLPKNQSPKDRETQPEQTTDKVTKKTWLSSSVLIWICHFIVFLGVYPGFFVYDAREELMETLTGTFSTHHPLIHVLSMGTVVTGIQNLFGDVNLGIACFILIGMTIAAITYGYLVYRLRKMGLKKLWAIILTVYFGIFPVFVMYSLCSSKDGVFGCFLILSFIYIKDMIEDPKGFFSTLKNPAILVVFLTMMMLLRNNGVYALAGFAIIFVIYVCYKRKTFGFRALSVFVAAIVMYIIVNSAMIAMTNAETGEKKEILTVPIMQLARTYVHELKEQPDGGPEETDVQQLKQQPDIRPEEADAQEIMRYISKENLSHYSYKISDMVKCGFNEEEFAKDRKGFFKIWWKLLKKHPATYLNAALGTSYGLWYPWATIDAYKGNTMWTFTYGDSSYFGYEVEEPGVRNSTIPFIDNFYRWLSLDVTIQKIPVLHLLFSPGFMLWVYLFFMGYFIYSGNGAISYLLPLMVVLTCFLGPVSLVRYSFFLWGIIPVMGVETSHRFQVKNIE